MGADNLNSTTPAAPGNKQLVVVQADAIPADSTVDRNFSFYDPTFVGDTGTGGKEGNVPAPAAGDAAAGKFLKADGTFAVPPSAAVGGRNTATKVTASLAANAEEQGTVALAKSFRLVEVSASRPCRIRLYSTAAAMTADSSRPFTTPPTAGTQHGVICDLLLLTAGQYTLWIMSPAAAGSNCETTPTTSISYAIQNRDTITATVSVTFTFLTSEA